MYLYMYIAHESNTLNDSKRKHRSGVCVRVFSSRTIMIYSAAEKKSAASSPRGLAASRARVLTLWISEGLTRA